MSLVLVHRIAPSGHFLEDVVLADDAEVPADCVATHPPEGFQWPRWDAVAGTWACAGVPYVRDADGVLTIPLDPEE